MDNGARFVLDNVEKAINVCKSNEEYRGFLRKIRREYSTIKYIQTTGNMIEYFDKFRNSRHKYAEDFAFLNRFGVLTNEVLSDYLRNHYPEEANNIITLNDIREGMVLSHAEIYIYFGGSTQGAAIRRNKAKGLFILVLDRRHNRFFNDGSIDFNFVGGDGSYDESKNLLKYRELNSVILVFRRIKRNQYCYCGKYDIDGDPFERKHLKRIMLKKRKTDPNLDNDVIRYMTLEQASPAKLLEEPDSEERKECKANPSKRNKCVSNYTKLRANGKCDLCGKKAPFCNHLGQPFLECHHVIYIANDGPDRIYNTVALCPNCHREVHELGKTDTKQKLIHKIERYLKEENDTRNLERFNKLFGFKN